MGILFGVLALVLTIALVVLSSNYLKLDDEHETAKVDKANSDERAERWYKLALEASGQADRAAKQLAEAQYSLKNLRSVHAETERELTKLQSSDPPQDNELATLKRTHTERIASYEREQQLGDARCKLLGEQYRSLQAETRAQVDKLNGLLDQRYKCGVCGYSNLNEAKAKTPTAVVRRKAVAKTAKAAAKKTAAKKRTVKVSPRLVRV